MGIWLKASKGRCAWAARLWGAEETLHATIRTRRLYVVRAPDEEAVAVTRARLGEQAFAVAWAQGRTMTVEQVLLVQEEEPISKHLHLTAVQGAAQAHGLTPREEEVLRLIAEGLTNPQIAKRLIVSPVTINTHVRSIYSKLGISSRSAATRYVLEHPLTE